MKVQTVLGIVATAIVAATAAQAIHIGTAAAAPGGRLVVLDVRTGRVVTAEATPEPHVNVIDVRTGRIITPGYEFFLSQPLLPMAANTAAPVYPADGNEFRLNS